MPSHARPQRPGSPAERLAARRERRARNRQNWRDKIPNVLTTLPPVVLAMVLQEEWPGVPGFLASVGVAGLAAIALYFLLLPVTSRAEKLSAAQVAPRPRWQYLLYAAGWLAVTAGCVAGAIYVGTGWVRDPVGVLGWWCFVAGVGMLGRALCWGRVRPAFWWHRPAWLTGVTITASGLG